MSYFPPYSHNENKIGFELDLSNYATKSDLKKATGVDISQFAKKDYLADLKSEVDNLYTDELEKVPSGLNNLKSKIDRLGIGKLKTTPTDLSKLNNLLKKEVSKKTKYDDLVKKFHAIDTGKLVSKPNYNAKNKDIEDEMNEVKDKKNLILQT